MKTQQLLLMAMTVATTMPTWADNAAIPAPESQKVCCAETPARNWYGYVSLDNGIAHAQQKTIWKPSNSQSYFKTRYSNIKYSGGLSLGVQGKVLSNVVVGLEVFASGLNGTKLEYVGVTHNGGMALHKTTKIRPQYGVALKLGYAHQDLLMYIKAGYSRTKYNSAIRLDGEDFENKGKLKGYVIGAGFQYDFSRHFAAGLEYESASYKSYNASYTILLGTQKEKTTTNINTLKLRLIAKI